MAMIHKMSRTTSKHRLPRRFTRREKGESVKILKIKTTKGIETIYGVSDWGWSAETGDLYYRSGKELHHKYCISAEEIIVQKDRKKDQSKTHYKQ